MYSELLEDQTEARLIQLRQQRLRKPSKAEKRGSRNTSASATGYASDAIVPTPGMSFLTSQAAGNVYATTQLSMEPAGGQPALPAETLPALAPQFQEDPPQADASAVVAPVLAVEALQGERAEVR